MNSVIAYSWSPPTFLRSDSLSMRTRNCLANMMMEKTGTSDVVPDRIAGFGRAYVSDFYQVGKKTLAEIEAWLAQFELQLAGDVSLDRPAATSSVPRLPAPRRVRSTAALDGSHETLSRLIEILAPAEGDLVAFLECYFDESGTHEGSPVLSVAGYVFERDQCRALDLGWKQLLADYRLPFFHMTDCAHNTHPFDHLSREECIEVEKRAIRLINDHALLGVAIAANEKNYQSWFRKDNRIGGVYSYCCWQVLTGIKSWIERNNFQGEVAYFFEAGHKSQGEANALMTRIFNNPHLRSGYRYAAHAFVDKVKVRPVQTADILAWHWATHMKRAIRNEHRMRADFLALAANPQHQLFIANQKTMGGFIAYQRHLQGLPITTGITGRYGPYWFWCSFDGRDGMLI